MGANAQIEVPAFTAGQILTAAEMTQINTGIPVFATTTTRDAAFGGAGEKTLAEGQFAYIEATDTTQYYDGAAWQSVGVSPGMVLVKSQTIGSAVSSVTVTGAFNSTYDNYKITISGGAGSNNNNPNWITFQLGSTTTGYYYSVGLTNYAGAQTTNQGSNVANFARTGYVTSDFIHSTMELLGPNLAKPTFLTANWTAINDGGYGGSVNGYQSSSTQHTAFTITTSGVTMTGGTIRVYGYANS